MRKPADFNNALTAPLLLLLVLSTSMILANLYYTQPILLDICDSIGLAEESAGLIVTVGQIGYMMGMLLLAPLGDIAENRRLITLMTCGVGVGQIVCASSFNAALFMIGIFMVGVFTVATQVLVVFASGLAQPYERGRILGIIAAGLFLGIALSRPISSYMVGMVGWREFLFGAGVVMLILACLLYFFIPIINMTAKNINYLAIFSSMGQIFVLENNFLPKVFLSSGAFFCFSMFWSAVPIYVLMDLHFSYDQLALFTMAGLSTPPCVFFVGKFLDKGYSFTLLTCVFIIAIIAWASTMIFPVAAFIFVFAAIFIDPSGSITTLAIQQNILSHCNSHIRARINSLNISVNFCGGATGAALGPWLLGNYGWMAVGIAGVLCMFALLIINLIIKPTKSE